MTLDDFKEMMGVRMDTFSAEDYTIINMLIRNVNLMEKAIEDIEKRGIVCNISKNGEVLQKNHSISTYNDCVKNILNISKKLGLSPKDRKDLGLDSDGEDDFDKHMG